MIWTLVFDIQPGDWLLFVICIPVAFVYAVLIDTLTTKKDNDDT